MKIFVLISTIADGICRVPDVLHTDVEDGVHYVVSWQHSSSDATCEAAVAQLSSRNDVTIARPDSVGLCRNRNHAMQVAVGLMGDMLDDAVFVIADDDERFEADAFAMIRSAYERWPKLDVALFRVRSIEDGSYFKAYPGGLISWDHRPRYYYPCSVEMTFRSRVFHAGLRFDERFGLGSHMLCAGEEDIFLFDARRKGMRVLIFNNDMALTNPHTTGDNALDAKVLRSKGAVYGYKLGRFGARLRALREAIGLSWRHRRCPLPVFREIMSGVNYIRTWNRD